MLMQRPQSRVAQKLAYARWHLDWCDELAQKSDKASPERLQQHEALLQSSLFHLVSAYRAFLTEIAADIHLPPVAASPDVCSARRLQAAYADYLPPALMQCVNLEEAEPEAQGDMSDAWLAVLLDWFTSLERVGDTQPSPSLNRTGNQAVIAVGSDAKPPLTRRNLGYCLANLEQLIDSLRDDLQEC